MNKHILVVFLLACLWLLTSCSPVTVAPENTPVSPVETLPPVQPTASPEPSPTTAPGKVILVIPPGTDSQPIQPLLAELAGSAGWELETRPDLSAGEAAPEIKVVVMLSPSANLGELLTAFPQAQFIVFSPAGLSPAANQTVIQQRVETQAFLAGFISVLLSPDYRAAGLLPADGPFGGQLQEAFVNGGRYYCGVCAPGWPLGMYFPAVAALPAGSDGAAWGSAALDLFDNKKVDLYFVTPEALKPEVIDYLQDREQVGSRTVRLLGVQPPPEGLREQWAASLVFDDAAALREVWPQVSAGQGGAVLAAPLVLEHVNESMLSQGRLRLVEELMEEIQTGRVDPFTVAPQ